MLKVNNSKLLLSLFITLIFIACGEENNTKADTPQATPVVEENSSIDEPVIEVENKKPIANAGVDQNISFGKTIILDAIKSSDSDGSIKSYSWTLKGKEISKESSVVLENLKEGTYVYTLTVTDDKNAQASDSVEIRTYADSVVKFATNQGDILLKMMSNIAPKAVENFVTHSKEGYYNGVIFHRVIKDFMIQGGDPTGTGRGGESIWGTPFENETSPNVLFDRPFLLAMANADSPTRTKTNTSQFFITTKEASFLNGGYSIFGEVIDGQSTVTKIENTATTRQDRPIVNQTILKAILYFEDK